MKTKWTWIFIFMAFLFIGCFGDTDTETKYVTTEVEVEIQVTDTYESTPSSAYEAGKLTIIYKPSEDKNTITWFSSPTKTFVASWPIYTEMKKDRVYTYEMKRVLTTDANMWYADLGALHQLKIYIGSYISSIYQTFSDYTVEKYGLDKSSEVSANEVQFLISDIAENEEVYLVIDENLKKYFVTRRLN